MLLTADHDKVRDLFKRFEKAEGAGKQEIFRQIAMELTIHTKIEEEIFYPAVKMLPDLAEMVGEAYEEHNIVDFVLESMLKLSPDDERYTAKFTTLKENVEHHAEEEEKEMFPKAAQKLTNADEIGRKLRERKQQLMDQLTKSASNGRSSAPHSRSGTGRSSGSRSRKTASGSRTRS
jgi:hemerythrin superfamily protein